MDSQTKQRDMAGQPMSGFLIRKEAWWYVSKGDKTYRLVDEDSMMCQDNDDGSIVDFEIVFGDDRLELAKMCGLKPGGISWREIEEWYISENHPTFGGPFDDAKRDFEWLKLYFEPPRGKKDK